MTNVPDFSAFEVKPTPAPDFSAFEVDTTTAKPKQPQPQEQKVQGEDSILAAPGRVLPVDPWKQAVAGPVDLISGLVSLPALISEVPATLISRSLRDDEPKTHWLPEIMKNVSQHPFGKAAHGIRMAAMKALDIPEPVNLFDQPIRLATSFMLPGPHWITRGTTLAPQIIRALTPIVKSGTPKEMITRGLVQLGIGGGMDQGMRAYMEQSEQFKDSPAKTLMPTMWNPRARPTWLGGTGGIPKDEWVKAKAAMDKINAAVTTDTPDYSAFEVTEPQDLNDEVAKATKTDLEMDRQMEENEQTKTIKKYAIGAAAVAALYGAMRGIRIVREYPADLVKDMPIKNGENLFSRAKKTVQEQGFKGATKSTAKRAYETGIDQETHAERLIYEALMTKKGMTSDRARQLARDARNTSTLDSHRTHEGIIETGKFMEADGIIMTTEALAPLARKVQALPREKQNVFNNGMLARADLQRRAEYGDGAAILTDADNVPLPIPRLKEAINALKADEELYVMSNKAFQILSDTLEWAGKRDVLTPELVKTMLGRFKDTHGKATYLPGTATTGKGTYFEKMAQMMGHTSKGKEMRSLARWKPLLDDPDLPKFKPTSPLNNISQYMHDVIDWVNRNSSEYIQLSHLSGTQFKNGRVVVTNPKAGTHGRFVGMYDSDQLGNVKGNVMWEQIAGGGKKASQWTKAEKAVRKKFNLDERTDIRDWLEKYPDLHTVQKHGKTLVYDVPDKLLQSSIKMDRKIKNGFVRFLNQWSKNMMALTTGRLSPFFPAAFLYNQQVSTLRIISKEGYRSGAMHWVGSMRAIWKHFSYNAAKDVNTILTRNLDRNFGFFANMTPGAAKWLKAKSEKRLQNVMMSQLQVESGLTTSAFQGSPFSGNLVSALDDAVMPLREMYGANALPMVWRFWTHLNNAFHEAPGLNRAMTLYAKRSIPKGKGRGKAIRDITRETREDVGDMTKLPSNPTMRNIHAMTPYWGAMMQGWSVVGRAIRDNPEKFIPAVAATIILPTAMEITWNSTLDPEKKWDIVDVNGDVVQMTYREYYWKFFSPEQRNNNRILFIPGKPPSEAILLPADPMFSIIRGSTIELMDLFFNLSDGKWEDNGDHFIAGLTRFFDIPVNPVIGAGFALVTKGKDFRIGLNVITDPEEGESFSFFHSQPRATSRVGGDRHVRATGDEASQTIAAVIEELGGAGAAMTLAAYNAYWGGRDDIAQPVSTRLSRGLSELGRNIKKSARYTNPIFGGALGFNPNTVATRKLYAARENIRLIREQTKILNTEGMSATGKTFLGGDTAVPSDDPILHRLMTIVPEIDREIGRLDGLIKALKDKVTSSRHSGRLIRDDGTYLTPRNAQEKQDYIDAWNLDIATLKSMQWQIIQSHMEKFNRDISKEFDRTINIDLSSYSPRSNLTKQSTGSPN